MYDFWPLVIGILKDAGLKEKIIQIGGKDDPAIPGVDQDLRGQTKIRQTFYVLKNAKLHFGNCSFPGHVAGAYNTPEVILYGPTTPSNHGPYWKHPKTALIESDRGGKKPSFSSFEPEKTIDLIKPETVANSILSILGYAPSPLKTVHLGKLAFNTIIEYIPDFVLDPNAFGGSLITARCDYHLDENILFSTISQRKVSIITDKELNLPALHQFKQNIANINYEVKDDARIEYLSMLKRTGVKLNFFSRAKDEELSALRFKFFDIGSIAQITEYETKIEGGEFVRSSKVILAGGKLYSSRAHQLANKPLDQNAKGDILLDDEMFWRDQDFQWVFKYE